MPSFGCAPAPPGSHHPRRSRPRRSTRSALVVLLAGLVLTLAACGGSEGRPIEDAAGAPADLSFTIPIGTGEAIEAGEDVEVIPPELRIDAGTVVEIVNQDDRGHVLGPFYAGAGETVRRRFVSRGTYGGDCSAHPDRSFSVVVS